MRSISICAAALCSSLALGASIPGLPACAGSCVTSFGSCNQLDVKCICGDSTLLTNLSCCVSQTCNAADQNATIQFADSLCAGQGITNLPTAATCAPGASGAAATSATSGSASSGQSSTTTPASLSSALASASSAAASASSSNTAAQASASSTNAAASSSVVSHQSSAAAAATQSSEAKALGVKDIGLGMVVAGLVAAL